MAKFSNEELQQFLSRFQSGEISGTSEAAEVVEYLVKEVGKLRANVTGVSWTPSMLLIEDDDPQFFSKFAAFARWRATAGDGFVTFSTRFMEAVGDNCARNDDEPELDEESYFKRLEEIINNG